MRLAKSKSKQLLGAPAITLIVVLAFTRYAAAAPAEDRSLAADAGYGIGSVLATTLYAPLKVSYATLGALVGGLSWAVTGGDAEVAKSVVGPAVRGTYVIGAHELRHPQQIAFVGRRIEVSRSASLMPNAAASK